MSGDDGRQDDGLTARERLELWLANYYSRTSRHSSCRSDLKWWSAKPLRCLALGEKHDTNTSGDEATGSRLQAIENWLNWDGEGATRH